MVVGVDGYSLSKTPKGLGKYTRNIINGIACIPDARLVVYVPDITYANELRGNLTIKEITITNEQNAHEHWTQIALPETLSKYPVDIFFGPTFDIPIAWPGPKVVMVHDRIFELPPKYHPASDGHNLKWGKRCAHAADGIITNSDYVKCDIERAWGLKTQKIRAIPLAPTISPRNVYHSSVPGLVSGERYILNVGGIRPRKNVYGLIDAFIDLDEQLTKDLKLVIVATPDPYMRLYIRAAGIESKVIFTGYCDDCILSHLYAEAELFVYPSLMEGFGLPTLEAMVHGTPVICSAVGAIPEVVGDGALLIRNPENATEIKDAIEQVLMNKTLANDLRARGLTRARKFSWDKTVQETYQYLVDQFQGRAL